MFDIKAIRRHPQAFDANWSRRGLAPQSPAILEMDEALRAAQTDLQSLLHARKEKSREIGAIKSRGGDAGALTAEVSALKEKITELEGRETELAAALSDRLAALPNMLADDVPDGEDESGNAELRRIGTPAAAGEAAPDHVEIGQGLGMMDFEAAVALAGSRFTLLRGDLARLERALAAFMLDTHTRENGYTEVSPPLMVHEHIMYGTGQLPKFAEDQFKTVDGRWLIPTAEVVLTNMVNDRIVDEAEMPMRLTACTPCFRAEAGAAGRDTRGMIRLHQFTKVELVSITRPEESEAEHERMTACAEGILQALGLPFRTVLLCSGDIGFCARKTYDLEVWLPGQGTYREISSCSNCGDFQARRMKARMRRAADKDIEPVHTLNGSGVAVGRALVAVMENYFDPADGGVVVPEALRPYMGGLEKIRPLTAETAGAHGENGNRATA